MEISMHHNSRQCSSRYSGFDMEHRVTEKDEVLIIPDLQDQSEIGDSFTEELELLLPELADT